MGNFIPLKVYVEIPLSLVFDNRVFGYWFPPYKKYIPHRLRVLRLALKDLERIKEILFCSMNARDVLFSGFFVCGVLVCP